MKSILEIMNNKLKNALPKPQVRKEPDYKLEALNNINSTLKELELRKEEEKHE